MKTTIKDGKLIIEIELQEPAPSASGKTMVIATTRGNVKTDCKVEGHEITIGLNAYYKR